ncbi:MAG TPA: helix-turn-helix transcriptional regulator [Thermoanaerobaculia bacterium]|jgi:transcriptional regulator with XRE-family HTH domain|nr:helix-turn-helix transcriptional regulator [Thermoanaerobaculia bacterium]
MASHLRPFRDSGPAVRLLRETADALEQAQVAESTGIAQNRLSHDENERQLPDLPNLDRLLARYGIDMERLDPQFRATIERGYIKPEEPD